jgi:hypothetical protein
MVFFVLITEQFSPEREVIEGNNQSNQSVCNRSIGCSEYLIEDLQVLHVMLELTEHVLSN